MHNLFNTIESAQWTCLVGGSDSPRLAAPPAPMGGDA
jgi:hypothetical protein